jgi:hypothetical protein
MRFVRAALIGGLFAFAALPASAAYINPVTNQIVADGTGNVIVKFVSQSAANSSNVVSLPGGGVVFNNQSAAIGSTFDIGSFAAGSAIKFRLDNLNTGLSFYTGQWWDNFDLMVHARLSTNADGSIRVSFEDVKRLFSDKDYNDVVFDVIETPIPGALALLLTGLLGLGAAGSRNKTA